MVHIFYVLFILELNYIIIVKDNLNINTIYLYSIIFFFCIAYVKLQHKSFFIYLFTFYQYNDYQQFTNRFSSSIRSHKDRQRAEEGDHLCVFILNSKTPYSQDAHLFDLRHFGPVLRLVDLK